jgi:hypothetical protein
MIRVSSVEGLNDKKCHVVGCMINIESVCTTSNILMRFTHNVWQFLRLFILREAEFTVEKHGSVLEFSIRIKGRMKVKASHELYNM